MAENASAAARGNRSEEPATSEPYRVCRVDRLKGLGAVAARPIARGELLLAEPPVVVFQGEALEVMFDAEAEMLSKPGVFDAYESSLRETLKQCGPKGQRVFWELADSSTGEDGEKTAVGISRTNALTFGEDNSAGVFPHVSRFNHHCSPNVHSCWQEGEGVQTLRAVTDIEAGSELCISYLSHRQLCTQVAERRSLLENHFGFSCACSACALKGMDRANSVMRRRKLEVLNDALQQAADLDELGGPGVVHDAAALLVEEMQGGGAPGNALVYYTGFWLAMASDRHGEAARFARLAEACSAVCEGPSSWRAVSLGKMAAEAESKMETADATAMEERPRPWARAGSSAGAAGSSAGAARGADAGDPFAF